MLLYKGVAFPIGGLGHSSSNRVKSNMIAYFSRVFCFPPGGLDTQA